MSSLAANGSSSWSQRKSRVSFILVLLSLSNGSVQSFAIGDDRRIRNNNNIIQSHLDPLPKVLENIKGYRTSTALGQVADDLAGGANDSEGAADVPSSQDSYRLVGRWPCFDKLDKELIRISLPVIGNNAIGPMIGAVDLFWVNRMGNALAVAGQSAANQVFNSAFWFTSFLPSGTNSVLLCPVSL
jgi:hypothetical protein